MRRKSKVGTLLPLKQKGETEAEMNSAQGSTAENWYVSYFSHHCDQLTGRKQHGGPSPSWQEVMAMGV